jgi:hypothetical protein
MIGEAAFGDNAESGRTAAADTDAGEGARPIACLVLGRQGM